MALHDRICLPQAATGAAVVAANSVWVEGTATAIGTPSTDIGITGIEIQCEDPTSSPDQDTTIEMEFRIYVASVLQAVIPMSMRYDTNAGFYRHDPLARQWFPEPLIVPAGSAITMTSSVSDTTDRNWRVKVRATDLATAISDSDTVTLTLTPSAIEVAETVDSDTILLTLTLEGVEERVSEDADTIPLVLTAELVEDYVPGVSGTEYLDSGTITLTLTPGGAQLFAAPILDDFNRANGDIGSAWSGDAFGGSNKLQIEDNEVRSSAGNYVTNWWNGEEFGPDVEVSTTIKALPDHGAAVWLEARVYSPSAGLGCYHLEYYRYTESADKLRILKVTSSSGAQQTDQNAPDMEVGTEVGLRVYGQDPVHVEGWVKQPGGDWTLITSWEDSSGSQIYGVPGFVALGIGSTVTGRADNFRAQTIGVPEVLVGVDSATITLALTPTLDEVYSVVYEDSGTIALTLTPSGTDTFHTVEGAPSAGLGIANVGRADLNLGNTPTTITLTTGVAVPAGSRIYVGILVDSGGINDDMSDDDLGLTWVKVEEALDPYSQSHTALFYADTSAELALGTVVSVTVTGGWAYVMVASSFTGSFIPGFTTTEAGAIDDATWEGTISPSGPALVVTAVGARGTSAEYSSIPDSGTIEANEHERTTAIEQGVTLNYKIVDTAGSTTLSGTFPAIFNWSSVTTESGIAVAEPVYLTLTPTLDEEYVPGGVGGEYLDSGTALLTLTASGIDVAERADAVTILLTLTASGIEQREITDAQTAILVLTPSAVEIREIVDTGTIGLTLSPSASEVLAAVESGTVNLQLTPSGVTQREILEAATIPVTLTASGVDVAVFVEVATILLDLTASGFDEYTGATAYTDSDTIPLTFTTSGIEERVSEDSATTTVNVTISYTEGQETYDSGTIGMVLSPTGVDTVEAIEVSIVDLRLAPSGTETLTTSAADTGEVYVDLQPTGVEVTTVLLMDLSSRAYPRWQTTTGEQNYTSYSYMNWKSLAVKRWNSDDQSRFR